MILKTSLMMMTLKFMSLAWSSSLNSKHGYLTASLTNQCLVGTSRVTRPSPSLPHLGCWKLHPETWEHLCRPPPSPFLSYTPHLLCEPPGPGQVPRQRAEFIFICMEEDRECSIRRNILVRAQEVGSPDRQDLCRRPGNRRRRPCMQMTGRPGCPKVVGRGKAGEARGVLPAPEGPDKGSLGSPAHPAGSLWPVTHLQVICLLLHSCRFLPFAYVAALGSLCLALDLGCCCSPSPAGSKYQFMGQCLSMRQKMQIEK